MRVHFGEEDACELADFGRRPDPAVSEARRVRVVVRVEAGTLGLRLRLGGAGFVATDATRLVQRCYRWKRVVRAVRAVVVIIRVTRDVGWLLDWPARPTSRWSLHARLAIIVVNDKTVQVTAVIVTATATSRVVVPRVFVANPVTASIGIFVVLAACFAQAERTALVLGNEPASISVSLCIFIVAVDNGVASSWPALANQRSCRVGICR